MQVFKDNVWTFYPKFIFKITFCNLLNLMFSENLFGKEIFLIKNDKRETY